MPTRRQTLRQLSVTAFGLALGRVFTPGQAQARPQPVRWSSDPFRLGVASGMPRPDSVVLWTRLAPHPLWPDGGVEVPAMPVQWELADDEHFTRVRRSGTVPTRADLAHSVHVEVTGLAPDRRYHYRFICGDAISPVGRTRTAPAPDAPASRLRLALASCQHYEQGLFGVHRHIAQHELDLVLFVGDYIYESTFRGTRIREHEAGRPRTLEQYRARHAHYKTDPDLQAAHAAHPWVLTWDDHEVENDYANDDGAASGLDPQAFLAVRAAAYQAYFEHMPVSASMAPSGPHMRIHDRYDWGRLASIWTLDARQYRDPQACPDPARGGGRLLNWCAEASHPGRTLLGEPQERWLRDGLRDSQRTWKLLGNNSQVAPAWVHTPVGHAVFSDWWDGYPAARERLMRFIAAHQVGNVLSLGGDVHRHGASQLRLHANQAESPIVASEFVTSSISSRGLPPSATRLLLDHNLDMVHARGDERGYAFVQVTPERVSCDFLATAHPVREEARLHRQARYVVEEGHPGVVADLTG